MQLVKDLLHGSLRALTVIAVWGAFLYVMEKALWPSLVVYL